MKAFFDGFEKTALSKALLEEAAASAGAKAKAGMQNFRAVSKAHYQPGANPAPTQGQRSILGQVKNRLRQQSKFNVAAATKGVE